MKKSIKELINDKLMVSLRQFEKEAGVTRQTVYNIQNGKGNPTLLTVKKICAYFGVDYKDYILFKEQKNEIGFNINTP